MSDAKYFIKCRAADLQVEINLLETSSGGSGLKKLGSSRKEMKHKKQCMLRILANMTLGNHDMITLAPYVLKYFNLDDTQMKKWCLQYFANYFFIKKDLILNNQSSFVRELNGTNAMIVGLTLSTIVYFEIESFQQEVSIPFLKKFLKSDDIYLKNTACFAVAKLFEKFPILVKESTLIDYLINLLDNDNAMIVSSSVAALTYIDENSPEEPSLLILDYARTLKLIKCLPRCNEFFQVNVLSSIEYFVPETNEQSTTLIEEIIPYLQHSNTSVVLNALKTIFYLCNYVVAPQDNLPYLPKKIGNSLISLISKPPEIQFIVLRNIILILLSKPNLVMLDVTMFFIQYNDPIYIKDTKLEIIYLLANKNNVSIVLNELQEYATDIDVNMTKKATRAIGNLAIKIESAATHSTAILLKLCSNGMPHLVQQAVIVMKNIYRKYPGEFTKDTIDIFMKFADLIEDPESKSSFIWIIGSYCDMIPDTIELLKDFTFTFKDEELDVQLTILTAVVKFYLHQPKKGEELLLEVLQVATTEVIEPDVRDRAYFYWRLLSSQQQFPNSAKDIILEEPPIITDEQEKLDSELLEELELNIGSLASIYLKPVQQLFRMAKKKELLNSNALQVDFNKTLKSPNPSDVKLQEKVLKINTRSNLGIIKSPKFVRDNSFGAFEKNEFLSSNNSNDDHEGFTRFSDDEDDTDNTNEFTHPKNNAYSDEEGSDQFDVFYSPKNHFDNQRFMKSNSIENGSFADSSRNPKIGTMLKKGMSFARRKSVAAPKITTRNFTN